MKSIITKALLALTLFGASFLALNHQTAVEAGADNQQGIISEIHTITKVTSTEVYGESTYFGGEGIYYTKDILSQFTKQELKVGDRVEIQWTEKAVSEGDWENVYSFRILQ